MIDIRNLSIQFTGENLFEDVNIKIHRKDKIALVGSNGKGKSTLLKLLIGIEHPESGQIIKQKGIRIGYLPQDLISFKGNSLFDEVKSSMIELIFLTERENQIVDELNNPSLVDVDREELLIELGDLHDKKERFNFYSTDSKIKKILSGLGFKEKDFYRPTEEFSGGWQMRIQLAKILIAENDLLLLDEPTNHLDIDTMQWLIDFLQNFDGSLIVVSHDRHFINSVTNKTLEIFNHKIEFFPGNYEKYLLVKDERDTQLKELQKNREKKIKDVERFIERFRYKNTKAKQVQSRIKMLDKMESIDLIEEEKKIEIRFPEPPRSGIIPIQLKEVYKSYGTLSVLENINLQIERGEKIAIVGPNGAGKTTLAKIIASKLQPTKGEVIYSPNTTVAYYEQEVADSINSENDLIDTLYEVNNELTPGQIRSLLGAFLFSGDDVFKKVGILSGGEKSRIALARLMLTKSNFIVLDEPTNHLDFNSKAVLQKALAEYSGTFIIVSHDIDFLKPIITKVIDIRNSTLKIYYGGIDYYLLKKNEENDSEYLKLVANNEKFTRKDKKRIEAETRQQKYILTKDLKNELATCEKEIAVLESLKSSIEVELTKPEVFSNPEKSKSTNSEYEQTKELLDREYDRWTQLTHQLEQIEKKFNN